MENQKLYQSMASMLNARENCAKSGNSDWFDKWSDMLHKIESNQLPSGSGIDSGTSIDLDKSTGEKIILSFSFHHMDESGYDGWTEHTITVKPSLQFGFTLSISGPNRNDIKDYLADVFQSVLSEEVKA